MPNYIGIRVIGVVVMNEAVLSFLSVVREKEHILELIHQIELSLTFKEGQECISLAFKNGEILQGKLLTNYEISGDIQLLLEGEEPLRVLLRKGKINLDAPFRVTLLLESFFYLSKGNHMLQKII
jgi:hypothetical protein